MPAKTMTKRRTEMVKFQITEEDRHYYPEWAGSGFSTCLA